jgi:hypothetical protein
METMQDTAAELAAMEKMTAGRLREKYLELFGEEPSHLNIRVRRLARQQCYLRTDWPASVLSQLSSNYGTTFGWKAQWP